MKLKMITTLMIGLLMLSVGAAQVHAESAKTYKLMQMDFPIHAMSAAEMDARYQDLAKSIAVYPGLVWKIWTVNEAEKIGGGVYLFDNEKDMYAYKKMHTERLGGFGIKDIRTVIFDVPAVITGITRGPVPAK